MSSPYDPPETEVGPAETPVVSRKVPISLRIARVLLVLSSLVRTQMMVRQPEFRTAVSVADAAVCWVAALMLMFAPRLRATHVVASVVLAWNVLVSGWNAWETSQFSSEWAGGQMVAGLLTLWLFACYTFGRPSRRYAGYAV